MGWLRIASDRTGLIANASFGDRGDNFFSSVQLNASPQRELVNSHVANGAGFGTGITFLNPFPDDTEVEVEFFDTEGRRTGGGDVLLQGFEHRPLLLTEIDSNLAGQIGGFIQVSSSRGIFAFELFFFVPPGTGSVISLSAVPPQRGNGFLEGVVTPVQSGALSAAQASGYPLRADYPASASRGVRLDPNWDFRPGEIIVKLRSSIDTTAQNSFFESLQLRVHREAPGRTLLLRSFQVETPGPIQMAELESTPSLAGLKLGTLDLIERLNNHPDVEYAEPNYILQPAGSVLPNDPLYTQQWHYPFINLPQAWQLTTGDPNLVVAVIDTGAKFSHPDLAGRLTGGQFDFIDDPQIAGDGDGIDAIAEDPGDDPVNPTFHGTHVAGTVGAATNNGVGVAGGNWNSKLMTLRALGIGGGTTFDIMQAARFAAGLSNVSGTTPVQAAETSPQGSIPKASVINMSLGSARPCSQFERENFSQILAQGVSVVVAAGNSNTNDDFSPASCPGVINVGAVGPDGTRAPYSNFGPRITGVAPGGDLSIGPSGGVLSTWWNDAGNSPSLRFNQGTSMAAPHVAAIVSLMKSVNPALSPAQVKQILEQTAVDLLAPGRDDITGFGRFDAFRAVATAAGAGLSDPILALDTTLVDFGNGLDSLPVTLTNIGGATLNISSISPETDSGRDWLSVNTSPSSIGPVGASSVTIALLVNRSGLVDGEYTGRVRISSDGGDAVIEARMLVGAVPIVDVGQLFVLAIDPRTLQTQAGVTTSADQGYAYRFQVQAGEYSVLAATDTDGDRIICEPDDVCGWFPVDNHPTQIQVSAGATRSGVSFLVRRRDSSTAFGLFPGGFAVPRLIVEGRSVEAKLPTPEPN